MSKQKIFNVNQGHVVVFDSRKAYEHNVPIGMSYSVNPRYALDSSSTPAENGSSTYNINVNSAKAIISICVDTDGLSDGYSVNIGTDIYSTGDYIRSSIIGYLSSNTVSIHSSTFTIARVYSSSIASEYNFPFYIQSWKDGEPDITQASPPQDITLMGVSATFNYEVSASLDLYFEDGTQM